MSVSDEFSDDFGIHRKCIKPVAYMAMRVQNTLQFSFGYCENISFCVSVRNERLVHLTYGNVCIIKTHTSALSLSLRVCVCVIETVQRTHTFWGKKTPTANVIISHCNTLNFTCIVELLRNRIRQKSQCF